MDDEQPIRELVRSYLARDGMEVFTADDGPTAIDAVGRLDPDVVVLDLMLPGLDGVEVCRQLRSFSDAYVVMLTARDEEVDRIVGLSIGADDYMVKPFSPRELVARVRALLRRPGVPRSSATASGMEVDTATGPSTSSLSATCCAAGATSSEWMARCRPMPSATSGGSTSWSKSSWPANQSGARCSQKAHA